MHFKTSTLLASDEVAKRLIKYGFMPLHVNHMGWEDADIVARAGIKKYIEQEFINYGLCRGIAISSGIGGGKTTILALIAGLIIKHIDVRAKYITTTNIFQSLADKNGDSFKDDLLLFIDDFGWEYPNAYLLSRFTDMMKYRYGWGMPTFIATNMTLRGFMNHPLDAYKQIGDLMSDQKFINYIEMDTKSKRQTEIKATNSSPVISRI